MNYVEQDFQPFIYNVNDDDDDDDDNDNLINAYFKQHTRFSIAYSLGLGYKVNRQ